MLVARWDFSAAVSLQACGTLTGATVTSHVRSHSCTRSPRDLETFLHPSRKGPADLLGCHWAPLTRLFGGMMCSAFPGGTGGLPNSDLCGRVGESPPQVLSPVSVVIALLRKRFPGPQKWPVFQHCLPCISDAHYSLRATALENLQPLPNNVL